MYFRMLRKNALIVITHNINQSTSVDEEAHCWRRLGNIRKSNVQRKSFAARQKAKQPVN